MDEQLITFETAKLAKEKGFDLRQDITYTLESSNEWYESKGITQSLLQRWLREVHNIHIAILPKILPSNEVKYYCFKGKLKKDFNNLYNTYEEALEVGLFEALKLIKDETNTN